MKPQKARPWDKKRDKDYFIENENFILALKHDGHRVFFSNKQGWTSNGKDFTLERIQIEICDGCLLDGELVLNQKGLEFFNTDISKAKFVSTAKAHHPELLKFIVFDCLEFNSEKIDELPYIDRFNKIQKCFKLQENLIEIEKHYKTQEEINSLKELVETFNHEGIMRKKLSGKYNFGGRTEIVKWKIVGDEDYVLCDEYEDVIRYTVTPGGTSNVLHENEEYELIDGKYFYPNGIESSTYKMGYKVICYGKYLPSGDFLKMGKSGISGKVEDLKSLVGKVYKVEHRGIHETGLPNHGVFICEHESKKPNECIWCPEHKVSETNPCDCIKEVLK